MKTVYFMRHGETDWNRQERLQGQQDVPLNETGRRQAIDAGKRFQREGLRFDRVIASTLCRAGETAALATGLPFVQIERDARIVEMSFGQYDGAPYTSLAPSIWDFFREPSKYPTPEGMERSEDMERRFASFLDELADDPREETVLIVTHGVAIRAMTLLLQPELGDAVWSLPIENCVLYRTELRDGTSSAPMMVDLSHI